MPSRIHYLRRAERDRGTAFALVLREVFVPGEAVGRARALFDLVAVFLLLDARIRGVADKRR